MSRWQRKKQQRKKQRRKRGTKPDAVLTASNFFGVTTLTSTREENLFSSRFFCTRLHCHVERSETSRFIAGIRGRGSQRSFALLRMTNQFSIVHFVLFVRRNASR